VTLRAIRTAEGIQLPLAPRPGAKEPEPAEPSAEAAPVPGGLALAVGQIELRDSRLLLDDRTVQPPMVWELSELEARARGWALDAPLDVEASAALGSGGRLHVTGTARLDGVIDLQARLDEVSLEPASRYLAPGQRVAGALSGTLAARGPAASPEAIRAELQLDGAQVQFADVTLSGPVSLRANLDGGLERGSGRFAVDATQAEVRYGDAFHKPQGRAAQMTGSIALSEQGVALDGVELTLHNLQADARVRTGKRTRVELDAPPFEVKEWAPLIPALAPYEPAGRIALSDLQLATAPLELRGRIPLDDLRVRPPEREPIVLQGALEGQGAALGSRELRALIGGQPIDLDVSLTDLERAPRYRVQARADKVQARPLLAALADMGDVLDAPLTLDADLAGPTGGPRPPLEALGGRARVELGQGTLKGVSLLKSSFERVGTFAEAAILADSLRGGTRLQRFYGDQFESASATFRIADGLARTDDLTLVYRHYTAELRGSLGLVDQALDFTGKLTIDREVDAALAGGTEASAAAAPASEAATPEPRAKVIPLARVAGTLSSPRVELTREAVVALAGSYVLDRRRESLERKLDERLGEGAGRQTIDALEGILGRRGRGADQPDGAQPPPD
jgi:AsmA protein